MEDLWDAERIYEACGLANPAALDAIRVNWLLVYAQLVEVGQASRASCAAAIGTIALETASSFQPVREAFWLTEEWRRANLRYYPFYGRGFIQLTWDYNYRRLGDAVGEDLVQLPDLALEPGIAARIFARYWADRNIQEQADRRDWAAVRRSVQGADAGLDRLTRIAEALLAS